MGFWPAQRCDTEITVLDENLMNRCALDYTVQWSEQCVLQKLHFLRTLDKDTLISDHFQHSRCKQYCAVQCVFVCALAIKIINLCINKSIYDETQHWCTGRHITWQHTRTWLIARIFIVYSSNICMLTYILPGPQVKVSVRADTLIYHPSITSGLDNISVPHPPVRSWSTDTPLAAWILPGRTSASGSV